MLTSALTLAHGAAAYRPFDGSDADVAQPGELELELGALDYERQAGHAALLVPVAFNLGLAPRLELVADAELERQLESGASQRLVDTDVLFKCVLRQGSLQQGSGPSVALELGPLLPEVGGEVGLGVAAELIVSQRWSALTLHLGNELALSREERRPEWMTSLIAEVELGAPLRPVAELTFARDAARERTLAALGGAIWELSDALALDAAARVANAADEAGFELRVGLTWTAPIWRTPRAADAQGATATASRGLLWR